LGERVRVRAPVKGANSIGGKHVETATLYAPSISCMHCIMAIKRAVGRLDGVSSVEGDPNTKRVEVTYDPQKVTLAQIKQAMADEGYPVSG